MNFSVDDLPGWSTQRRTLWIVCFLGCRPAVGSLPPVRFALSLGLRFDNDNCRLAGLHPVLIWLLPPVGARLRYRADPVRRGHFRAEVWVGRESSCPFPRTLHRWRIRA